MSKSEELLVYADLLSQPCRAVVLFLKANNVPFTLVQPGRKSSTTSLPGDQPRINLVQLVPEIDDGGFMLTECEPILKYLCGRSFAGDKVSDTWYPTDLKQRARVDEFCTWCSMNIHTPSSYIYIYQILDPKIKNIPVDRERLRRHKVDLDRALDKFEGRFLADGGEGEGFVCGESITVADLMAACEVTQPIAAGHDVMEGRPRLAAWFSRVKVRLHPYFEEVHAALQHTRDLRLRMIYQCSSFDVDY